MDYISDQSLFEFAIHGMLTGFLIFALPPFFGNAGNKLYLKNRYYACKVFSSSINQMFVYQQFIKRIYQCNSKCIVSYVFFVVSYLLYALPAVVYKPFYVIYLGRENSMYF